MSVVPSSVMSTDVSSAASPVTVINADKMGSYWLPRPVQLAFCVTDTLEMPADAGSVQNKLQSDSSRIGMCSFCFMSCGFMFVIFSKNTYVFRNNQVANALQAFSDGLILMYLHLG